jgi:hypothetical protein
LFETPGDTSIDTYPSAPRVELKTPANKSHASLTSVVSTSSKSSQLESPSSAALASCSSYSFPEPSAFWKIVGLDVIPASASSRIRRSSSPFFNIDRSMLSSQIDCPAA